MNPTLSPTRKVVAASIVGSLVTIVIYILNMYVSVFQSRPELAAMLTTLLSAIVAYVVPPGAGEGTVTVDGKTKTGAP